MTMENNLSNLIKNVLEENALKFKNDASEILYSKVSDRLKKEYIDVSKNLFKTINEAKKNTASGASRGVSRAPDSTSGTPRLRPAPTRNPTQHGGGLMGPGFHGGGLLPGANVDFAGMANDTPIALPVKIKNKPRGAYSTEEDVTPPPMPPMPPAPPPPPPWLQGLIKPRNFEIQDMDQQHSGGIMPSFYAGEQM